MDDGDTGAADDDERATELSTISAIYPEIVTDPTNSYKFSLDLAVTPSNPIKIRFQQSAHGNASQLPTRPTSAEQDDGPAFDSQKLPPDPVADAHDLAHLPPLTVQITLPEQYPARVPLIVRLSSTPPWIPQEILKGLQNDCETLWEELGRAEVIYTYIDHLVQATENAFGLAADGKRFQIPSDLKLSLLDFNLKSKCDIFEKETFNCGICLEMKKGSICHRLVLCGHVFCVLCLQDFYNNCITEGHVDNVKCLEPGCAKNAEKSAPSTPKRREPDRTINPSELLLIPIDQDLVQRYVRLKRKRKLEADKNTIYCPRSWCQGAARSKRHPKPTDPLNDMENSGSDSDHEVSADTSTETQKSNPEDVPMSERLSICEDCSFAFCSVCKKGWHGENAMCNPRRQNELNEEEKASLDYLKHHSTACPTCSAPSQKTMGCNHMICFKCSTHFCYLCSSYLMEDNPYQHFNDLKSTCYMRLWELEGGDGAEAGRGYAGRAEWEAHSDTDSNSEDDLEAENFADFAGDDDLVRFSDDEDDTSDEEPAPNQRRPDRAGPMQIELVNAAGQHIIHNLPERPRPAPPAAPVPPAAARRNRRRRGQQQAPNHRAPPHQGRPPLAPRNIRRALQDPPPEQGPPAGIIEVNPLENEEDIDEPVMVRVAAAPGQGDAAAQQPAPVRAMGLERFLELANNDQEDEWDSDELDDDIEVQPRARLRRDGRRY